MVSTVVADTQARNICVLLENLCDAPKLYTEIIRLKMD